jgi:branched-chain amino acid aminotransferase
MDIAKELGIPCSEQALTRYDLWTADECFLTGTAAEVIPCVEVDHRMVGEGKPGSLTKRFIDVFRGKVSVEGVKI